MHRASCQVPQAYYYKLFECNKLKSRVSETRPISMITRKRDFRTPQTSHTLIIYIGCNLLLLNAQRSSKVREIRLEKNDFRPACMLDFFSLLIVTIEVYTYEYEAHFLCDGRHRFHRNNFNDKWFHGKVTSFISKFFSP